MILVFVLSKCSVDIPKEVALEIESLPESIDFNYHVKQDKRITKTIIPIGDGFTICIKK